MHTKNPNWARGGTYLLAMPPAVFFAVAACAADEGAGDVRPCNMDVTAPPLVRGGGNMDLLKKGQWLRSVG